VSREQERKKNGKEKEEPEFTDKRVQDHSTVLSHQGCRRNPNPDIDKSSGETSRQNQVPEKLAHAQTHECLWGGHDRG